MISIKQLSVRYASSNRPILDQIDLQVNAGETLLVCGPTGCGKSTLLNCLNGTLLHESTAKLIGEVTIDGKNCRELTVPEICQIAGSVFQNPVSQLCTATPEAEIAFGLENLGISPREATRRIDEALTATGLSHIRHQLSDTLSGGQQQRLVIACALALHPKILLLDEPISQLDPQGSADILALLQQLKTERNLTIVMIEHTLEAALPLADQVLILNHDGGIADKLPANEILNHLNLLQDLGLNVPQLSELFTLLGREEKPLLPEHAPLLKVKVPPESNFLPHPPQRDIVTLDQVNFRYGKNMPDILQNLSLKLHVGERVALMGTNGAGKSTCLHLLAGLIDPTIGACDWRQSPVVGLTVQNPDLMLISDSVREELAFMPRHQKCTEADSRERVNITMQQLGLDLLADQQPFALSRGQRLRTAVGSTLTGKPSVLLLDEPTSGQDRKHMQGLMETACRHADLLVFCTHDLDMAVQHATRLIILHEGRILANGTPREVLQYPDILKQANICLTSLQQYLSTLGLQGMPLEQAVLHLSSDTAEVEPKSLPAESARTSPKSILPPPPSWLNRVDIRLKMATGFCISLLAVTIDHAPALTVLACCGGLLVLTAKPSRAQWRLVLYSLGLVVWGMIFSQSIFYERHPRQILLTLIAPNAFLTDGIRIYAEGITHGLLQSLRFVALGMTGYAICFSTPADRFMTGLRALKLPYSLSFMTVSAIRFVPVVAREALIVRQALKLKGYRPFRSGTVDTIKTEICSLRPVLMGTIRRSQDMALSMQTRGFSLHASRAALLQKPFTPRAFAALLVLTGLTIAILSCKLLFWLYQHQWFYHPTLRPLYAWVRNFL